MKKIVVTGGSGFIGSNLIDFLLRKKYFVINIDKSSYSANPFNVRKFKKKKNYIFFKLDINNRKKVLNILKKYKPIGIFNLAAETHVDRSIDNPKNFITSNVLGVYHLMEAVRDSYRSTKKKIKLLHVSTDEVYGDIAGNISANENFNYNPSSPYSASKAGADQLIKAYTRTYGLNNLIANPCNNYGPNQFPEKLIPKMIFNILNNKPLPVYGSGKNIREWIYVEDTCAGLLKIFSNGKIGENYNIGTGIKISNIKLVKFLLSIAKEKGIRIGKKTKIQFVMDRPGHDKKYALNSYKIKRKLKWNYKVSIKKGLRKTFDWYLKNSAYFEKISKKNIIKRFGIKV